MKILPGGKTLHLAAVFICLSPARTNASIAGGKL
jgi:hypothetical protein